MGKYLRRQKNKGAFLSIFLGYKKMVGASALKMTLIFIVLLDIWDNRPFRMGGVIYNGPGQTGKRGVYHERIQNR